MANDDLQSKAADFVKKALTVGVGAIFLTEESLRGLVSEIKLPKEILTGILDSGARTRNEFLSKLSTELIEKITDKVDPEGLVQELLENNEFEFTVRMKLKPKAGASRRARVLREEDEASEPAADEAQDESEGAAD